MTNVPITTIGGSKIETVHGTVVLHLHSKQTSASLELQALVLRSLSMITPPREAITSNWPHLRGINLADPDFMKPQKIEILLGADVYGSILLNGIQKGPRCTPIAQQTIFGWIILGPVTNSFSTPKSKDLPSPPRIVSALTADSDDDLSNNLERFWIQEEVLNRPLLSAEEQECERQFQESVHRKSTGQYIVRISKNSFLYNQLGESLDTAQRVLKIMLSRMAKHSALSKEYNSFMQKYEELGHMRPISPSLPVPHGPPPYYIPHHAIWRDADGKPKLRVVFNASRPTTTGLSVNQVVHTGPKLQVSLSSIIMRWRFFRVVFGADIKMMYRMICVDERDVDLQRIVWKRPEDTDITHFQLMTLTYGMSSSPYLALRTMQQLASDEEDKFPDAAPILRENTYVDDVYSGADSESSAAKRKNQLISMMSAAGLHLKKWVSNYPPLLQEIPESDRLRPHWRHFETAGPTNALGLAWDPVHDEFRFQPPSIDDGSTKRKVLSAIARLFDPVGWLSPIIIVAKVLMQDLWREKLDWDESLPVALSQRWMIFKNQLSSVSDIRCIRWLGSHQQDSYEIHGFGDASKTAYAATTLPEASWRYVPTKDNPADIATRGTDPKTLAGLKLWWEGPEWLTQCLEKWPEITFENKQHTTALDDGLTVPHILTAVLQTCPGSICNISTLTGLMRAIARCLRWKMLLNPPAERFACIQQRLHPKELQQAFLCCIYWTQQHHFAEELRILKHQGKLPKRGPLTSLHPFIDATGILRVGGRLANSPLSYEQKHPVVLPGRSHLADLIIDWAHKTALQGGFQLTYSCAIRRAWIIHGRVRVKRYLRNCVICARTRGQKSSQLMGQLPTERVTAARPFMKSGVDYAGPFALKATKGRGYRTVKGYIALFVCLSTKAVHLEVVGDLTTDSFLAALRRFIGRRGLPQEIWSDNATTFHGADIELRSMFREAKIDWTSIQDKLANQSIDWRFIPPSAPHFGGLWEAGIKSAKSYLKRLLGTRSVTYEEMTTLTVQIEMCMNSRPLVPVPGDPEDLDILTPGHALIGGPFTALPEQLALDQITDRDTHWQLIKRIRDNFWVRWAREYIHTLQQRNKWTQKHDNLKPGDLVLIVDSSLIKSNRWPLDRIVEVFPGPDGLVRAAKVRTAIGTYDRPIHKLCLLPVSPKED